VPTVLTEHGYRFYFYSNENEEPMHVHVEKGDGTGKVWLKPKVKMAYFLGFSSKEEKLIMKIVADHEEYLTKKWNEYFSK
jgi:hypothetical protein